MDKNESHAPQWVVFIAGMLSSIILILGGVALGWLSFDIMKAQDDAATQIEEENVLEEMEETTLSAEE